MMKIYLSDLLFTAYHGVYEEEGIVGGVFKVQVELSYIPASTQVNKIEETINYVLVYEQVKKLMEKPTPLLETLVGEIAQSLLNQFPIANEVMVKIEKLHPPIPNFQGKVGVSLLKKRDKG